MKITSEGLALIAEHEGLRLVAYRDAVGILTIGYGHTSMAGPPKVSSGMRISAAQARDILASDVGVFEAGVAKMLTRQISDRQFSALVSFAFNVGLGNFAKSSVLAAVNAGRFSEVPAKLAMWVKAGGRTLPGLVRRRAAEGRMFSGAMASRMPSKPTRSEVRAMQMHRRDVVGDAA